MGPVPWIALAAFLAMVLRPTLKMGETIGMARMRVCHRLFSDPILYLGLAFLFLLALQWWNGPRTEFFNVKSWAWAFEPPPKPLLPLFCVKREEALEMLYWFIPLYAMLVVLRTGFSRLQKLDLLRVLAANAAVMAIFGFVQYFAGTTRIYWTTPLNVHFFAAFGYQNHAAAFFVLATSLCLGLLLRSLLHRQYAEELPWLIPAMMLCGAATLFSKSRAGIVMIGLIILGGLLYGFKRIPRKASAGRTGLLVSLILWVAVIAYVAWVVPGNPVRAEWEGTTVGQVVSRLEPEGNPYKAAALRIWADHPWFGTGGWGFRRFLPHYDPADHYPPGAANVHADLLQFLAEFGAVGTGLLLASIVMLLLPALKNLRRAVKRQPEDPRAWFLKAPPPGYRHPGRACRHVCP